MNKWKKITNARKMKKPRKYRLVLISMSGNGSYAPSMVVGYRNSHGEFITPGGSAGKPIYYSDCLSEFRTHPLWNKPAEEWENYQK